LFEASILVAVLLDGIPPDVIDAPDYDPPARDRRAK